MAPDQPDGGDEHGREARQLFVLAVCVAAVVAAAVVTPAAAGGTPQDDRPAGVLEYLLDRLAELFDGGEEFPPDEGCAVAPLTEPVPGANLTVMVWDDGAPAPNSRVWFNGEFVGRTDEDGRVTGRVPYDETLRVRVVVPDGETCEFGQPDDLPGPVRPAGDLAPDGVAAGATTGLSTLPVPGFSPGPDRVARGTSPASTERWRPAQTRPVDEENYSVDGTTDLRIEGRPVPNGTVTLVATVERVPMRNATVTVDGERVGRTDDRGRYDLAIPADADRVRVAVTRGDFTAAGTVRVQRLSVALRPGSRLVPLPGQSLTVEVTRGPVPVAAASVVVDGRTVGTTGENGTVEAALPADPTATVTAREGGETARAGLWSVYARSGTILGALLVLVGATVGLGYLARGVRGVGYAVAFWLAVAGLAVATVRYGQRGFVGGIVAILALGVAWAAARRWTTVRSGTASLAVRLRAGLRWLLDRILRLSIGLTALVGSLRAWLGDVRAGLGWLAGRGTGLVGDVSAWIATLPDRAGRLLRSRWGQVGLAVLVLLVAAVVAARLRGLPGLLAVLGAGLVLALGLLAIVAGRSSGEEGEPGGISPSGTDAAQPVGDEGERPAEWLRRVWRRFAGRVVPDEWRTRTPSEVSRAAVSHGLPREPVERLTETFREVEYGGRSLSEARRELVADAAAVLEEAVTAEGGDDE